MWPLKATGTNAISRQFIVTPFQQSSGFAFSGPG
jgi:hypothetical protein